MLDEPPPGIEARPGFFAEEQGVLAAGRSTRRSSSGTRSWTANRAVRVATDDPDAYRGSGAADLPFELVCPTHGEITDRAAFVASLGI